MTKTPDREFRTRVRQRLRYGVTGGVDTVTPPLVAAVRDALAKEDFRWDTQHRLLPNADGRVPPNSELWEGCSPTFFNRYTAMAERIVVALADELPAEMRTHIRAMVGLRK